MLNKKKIFILFLLTIFIILIFLFTNLNWSNWSYGLNKRLIKIIAIIIVGSSIAFTSIIFQTITNNRILTPSILGLDSLYLFVQTVVVFFLGSHKLAMMTKTLDFFISLVLMVGFSSLLFKFLFNSVRKNILFLVLSGMIFGTLFRSLSTFMQVLIDPNEFQIIQDKMFANFNNINTELLQISSIISIIIFLYLIKYLKIFDVINLGRDHSISLGINYNKVVKQSLFLICILVSVYTALTGPITFLGIIITNLSYEFLKTYQHKYLIIGSIFISIITLVLGQFLVERVFNYHSTISIIINFVGGIYFIYLLLKEKKID